MNKQTRAAVAVIICVTTILYGCGSEKTSGKLYDYDLSKYIELGQYKDLKIPPSKYGVTELKVKTHVIDSLIIEGYRDYLTEGLVQEWDRVSMTYTETIGDDPSDSKSGTTIVGSGEYILEFEEGLIGKAIGETFLLKLKFPDGCRNVYERDFPDDYDPPDLSGKDAVYEITVDYAYRAKDLAEYIAASDNYSSIEEFIEFARNEVEETQEFLKRFEREKFILKTLTETSAILAYPESEVKLYIEIEDEKHKYNAKMQGLAWKEFLQINMEGMTPEIYDEWVREKALRQVAQEMMFIAITRKEGLELTKEEYEASKLRRLKEMGYESERAYFETRNQNFEEAFGGRENLEYNLTVEKVLEFIYDNAAPQTSIIESAEE